MSVQAPLIRVTRKHPCPVCEHSDWCSYWTDGRGAICMRIESDKQTRDGGWIHLFDSPRAAAPPRRRPSPNVGAERANVEHRHVVYTALLDALTLSDDHLTALEQRGLARAEIERLQFKSTPALSTASEIACALSRRFDLRGLPGFYQRAGNWRMVSTAPGFFVPYRNEQGSIEGLQIRRWPHTGDGKYIWLSSKDRPLGASSGAPLHFARVDLLTNTEEVIITEGALKADVAAYLSQSPVIAVAGVGNFGSNFAVRIRAGFPKLRRAILAYDRDFIENPPVYQALMRLSAQLERASFQVRMRTWPPPAKGYDDFLLSQGARQEVAA
jgi:hypothetical protein